MTATWRILPLVEAGMLATLLPSCGKFQTMADI